MKVSFCLLAFGYLVCYAGALRPKRQVTSVASVQAQSQLVSFLQRQQEVRNICATSTACTAASPASVLAVPVAGNTVQPNIGKYCTSTIECGGRGEMSCQACDDFRGPNPNPFIPACCQCTTGVGRSVCYCQSPFVYNRRTGSCVNPLSTAALTPGQLLLQTLLGGLGPTGGAVVGRK